MKERNEFEKHKCYKCRYAMNGICTIFQVKIRDLISNNRAKSCGCFQPITTICWQLRKIKRIFKGG